jgi:hypothetical protein
MIAKEEQRYQNILSMANMGAELILHTKNGELLKNKDRISDNVSEYKVWGNALLYTLEAGELIIYSEGKSQRFQGNFFLSHFWGEEERFIVLKEEDDGDVYYECNRNFEMSRMSVNDAFVKQFYKNYYITQEGDILSCYTLAGVSLWRHSINSLLGGEKSIIMSDLIPFKDRLFFYLNDYTRNESKTFCLKIDTGEILQASDHMKGWLTLNGERLFATDKKRVLILDANTLAVQSVDIAEQLSDLPDHLGMSYNKFSIANDLLFYTGERTSNVGVIDILNKRAIWKKQLNVDGSVIRQLLAYDNKFCVLDARDNFYSFEYDLTK